MKSYLGRTFLMLAPLALLGTSASAQVGANGAAASPGPANVTLSPDPADFARSALLVVNGIMTGSAGQVWDASSPVMKTIIGRDMFVQSMQQRAAVSGPLKDLSWRSIIRVQMAQPQGQLPAGSYLSVAVTGLNANNQPVVQTVSFILDSDQRWRVIGISAS